MTIVFEKVNADPEITLGGITDPSAICAQAFKNLNDDVQFYQEYLADEKKKADAAALLPPPPSPGPAPQLPLQHPQPPLGASLPEKAKADAAAALLEKKKADAAAALLLYQSPPSPGPALRPSPAMDTAKSTAFYLDHELFQEVIEYLLPIGRDITKLDYERFVKVLPFVLQSKSESIGGPNEYTKHENEFIQALFLPPFAQALTHKTIQFAAKKVKKVVTTQATITKPQTTINRCKLHVYDMNAIRIQYTFADETEPEVMYFFWDTEDTLATSSRKYLFGYQGCETEMIAAINEEHAEGSQTRSNEAAEAAFEKYLFLTNNNMPVLDPNKAFFYELQDTVDRGYWNDSAARLLEGIESPHSPNSNDKQMLEQFIHAIAKRLFLISFDFDTANIHFQHDKHQHKAVVNDEFHVILRLKDRNGLIFYTGKEVPEHCILSREDIALGRTTTAVRY